MRAVDRRTSVGQISDHLHDDIASLRLLPGDKLSEADAAAFGVSRHRARDAFSRLASLGLVVISPQRASEVARFSLREIEKARFVRASVEAEVPRRASARCDANEVVGLDAALDGQAVAAAERDVERFARLDREFHAMLCRVAGVGFAAGVIAAEKAKVDRPCMLSLAKEDRMPSLLEDHRAIAAAVAAGDAEGAAAAGMAHLSRLDATITAIRATNADYFEPDDA